MPSKSTAILSSHRDAATRVSDLFRTKHNLELNPSDALDVVATVLGAANWKTLSAMAKQGRAPRMSDLETAAGTTTSSFPEHAERHAIQRRGSSVQFTPGEARPTMVQGPAQFITEFDEFCSDKHSGKWCIFREASQVDAMWEKVRSAIRAGHFCAGMVSTAYGASLHGGSYVICAFTRDWADCEAVMRAREVLRGFGVTEELGYKRDIETANGVYGVPEEWYYRD